MSDNILLDLSMEFSVEIVKLCESLKGKFVLKNQLLRSGTSIGANVSEAERGQSKPDFYAKMAISLKEANETHYWISLLHATQYLSDKEYASLDADINEIISILVAICNSKNKTPQ